MTTWRNRIACWILNSTNTHSEYEVLIAFPLQLWLYERVSMLHNRYFACLVCTLCFPDGAGIMPVCVLRVGPIWSEESPNLYSKGAFGKYLIALWYSYAVAWHYFTNTRTPSLTRSHTYWYTLSFEICFHLPLGLLRCATSSSLEGTTGLGLPPSYSPLCPR